MNKLSLTFTTTLLIMLSFITSCEDNKNEQIKPSIEGKWTVTDRFLVSDQNDEKSLAFTKNVNNRLKEYTKEDYKIEKTYIKIGENEDRGLVGDIRTEYTRLKEGYPNINPKTNEFELKKDSITIYDGNLKNKGYCNIGEKILIIKRKVAQAELEPILESLGLVLNDDIPDGYTATYSTYEIR